MGNKSSRTASQPSPKASQPSPKAPQIPTHSTPPDETTTYIIDQLGGECITIPGSKGVFRILASAKQTDGGIAVFQSAAVLSDAPGFHYHNEAHDVFLVTKGYLKLWNGDECRIMGPGDFAYVPPKVVHNPEMLGPHTEILGLIAPGDWVDFFRYISEPYDGVLIPEGDDRDLGALLFPKIMAAKDRFDVQFVRDYQPPEVGEWTGEEKVLPGPLKPYFLRANTGPRWILGGVISRPFIRAEQTGGKFSISSIEGSSRLASPLARWLTFPGVHQCFCVLEGLLNITLRTEGRVSSTESVREGQTVMVAAGQTFAIEFGSRYVRALVFTNGRGIEELVHIGGKPFESVVLPEKEAEWALGDLEKACVELGVTSEEKA